MAQSTYDPKALEVLEAMSKRYKAIPAFTASIKSTLLNEVENIKEESTGEISVKGQKYFLTMDDQVIINDGKTVWTYLSAANEVNIDNYYADEDEISPTKIYDAYKKGHKYLYIGEATEAGTACHVVDLSPEKRDAQFFRIRLNISKKDNNLVSWTMYDKTGNKYTYLITKFNPNAKLDDNFFSFDPKKYPGVEIIDLR
ncbi:MAG TPA: outer membrane lipoprotein carrier protein LolA [Cyclobacteriaceae bacterium]|nr:outer membrane lipoprotein carrier protein LolA [Cyclobacteriaceae bacterium]